MPEALHLKIGIEPNANRTNRIRTHIFQQNEPNRTNPNCLTDQTGIEPNCQIDKTEPFDVCGVGTIMCGVQFALHT